MHFHSGCHMLYRHSILMQIYYVKSLYDEESAESLL